MKNLLLSFLLFFSGLAYGQELFIGAKGGLNVSNITNDRYNFSKLGMHAGIYGAYKFNEKMAGGVELLYNQKGTHHRDPHINVMVYIDYLDIPMLFHYYLSPEFSLHGGLSINAPIRGVRVYRFPRIPDEDFVTQIDPVVMSMPLGINYELAGKLNFGLRGDIGLSRIGGDNRKNVVLMLSIGYTFYRKGGALNIGKKGKSDSEKNSTIEK